MDKYCVALVRGKKYTLRLRRSKFKDGLSNKRHPFLRSLIGFGVRKKIVENPEKIPPGRVLVGNTCETVKSSARSAECDNATLLSRSRVDNTKITFTIRWDAARNNIIHVCLWRRDENIERDVKLNKKRASLLKNAPHRERSFWIRHENDILNFFARNLFWRFRRVSPLRLVPFYSQPVYDPTLETTGSGIFLASCSLRFISPAIKRCRTTR